MGCAVMHVAHTTMYSHEGKRHWEANEVETIVTYFTMYNVILNNVTARFLSYYDIWN